MPDTIDVNEMIDRNETVQYQYSYPLWMKILGAVGLVVVAWMLYDDVRAGRNLFIMIEMLVGASVGIWLVQVIRDDALYIVTDRRIMRRGGKRSPDAEITYPEISEVRIIKENFTGNTYVQVKTLDGRVIRVPMPGMGRSRAEELAHTIDQIRGVELNPQQDAENKAAED